MEVKSSIKNTFFGHIMSLTGETGIEKILPPPKFCYFGGGEIKFWPPQNKHYFGGGKIANLGGGKIEADALS